MKTAPLLAAAALLACASPAVASGNDLLSLGIGRSNILDNNKQAADFRAEYRWGDPCVWQLRPFAGIEISSKGAGYVMGGILWDWGFAPHFYLTPSAGVGLYHDGGGEELNSVVEFRTQLEVSYEFGNEHRLSAGFSHISNGGIDQPNPGTEVLGIYYHIPVNWFSGN